MRYIDDTGIEVNAAQWLPDDHEAFDVLFMQSGAHAAKLGEGETIIIGGRSTDTGEEITGRRETFQPTDWLVVHPVTGGWDRIDAATFAEKYEAMED